MFYQSLCDSDWKKILADVRKKLLYSKNQRHIFVANSNSLPTPVSRKSGLYAIWVDSKIKYIGQAQYLSDRLKNHFLNQGSSANKYEHILNALNKGKQVSFSFIEIEPASMRFAIEDGLINQQTTCHQGALPWNTDSVSKKTLEDWVCALLKNVKKVLKKSALDEMSIVAAFEIDFFGCKRSITQVLLQMSRKGLLKRSNSAIGVVYEL